MLKFPDNKKFSFTIIDDTDESVLENIKPVYDILYENNLRTTKTIWVYPPNDTNSHGDCLARPEYLDFVKDLHSKGFEIALHNVGGGDFKRKEIICGLQEFRKRLGFYPRIQVNHSFNKDNIYSGSKRFGFPFNHLMRYLYSEYDNFSGDEPDSDYFWGDYHKRYIAFCRNYEVDDINTYNVLPHMPFRDKRYDKYSNHWFGSTFAPNPVMLRKVLTKSNIDRLEKEGGVCILFTHLGYYENRLFHTAEFARMIEYIGKKNGWFVPVSTVLEFLKKQRQERNSSDYIPFLYRKKAELHSIITRIKYRYLVKTDDYNFRNIKIYEERKQNQIRNSGNG